jgi:type IV pilus assembly protein PilB
MQLGDILIQGGLIDMDKLQKAQKLQAQAHCGLGEAVVKLGFAKETDIALAVSKLLNVPYASRENKILRPEKGQKLDMVVNERFARENVLLPLFLEDKTLAVALAEPENLLVLDNLRMMTGLEIQPFISTKAEIIKTIDEFYSSSGTSLIDKVMESTGEQKEEKAEEEMGATERLDLDKDVAEARGGEVVALLNAVLKEAVRQRVSDIHLERYDERVMLRFRIDGDLYERTPPQKKDFMAMVSRIKIVSKLDIAERRLPQDGAFSMKVQNRIIDLRVSICPTVFGEKVVMRLLDKGAVDLNIEKIGFEPKQQADFLEASQAAHGLIFLTGPTGSGKTTTLYTVLNTIKSPSMNFMTIEDPVEFKLEGINQVQVRSSIGLTFASALRSFLRQDPDVILVGEVRDKETAETCLRAALTGHLVLSTLHTNSALEAVVRLVDMGIEPFMLASTLRLVAAQRLVRILCTTCKQAYKPTPAELALAVAESQLKPPPDTSNLSFYKAVGCDKCAKTGYMGRRAIYEVYFINQAMREGIYKHSGDMIALKNIGAQAGYWNMRASGWRKVLQGLTTAEEVTAVTIGD